jgi:DNA-binding transcriptional LysR family regulator
VAKRGSVTLAASEMMRNQPTISHQIKCLENEFGVTLFDRSRGRMDLTPEGKVFLEKAISLFEVIKEMKNEIGEAQLQPKGTVTLATTHAIIHYFLPPHIAGYRKQYPKVRFEIEGGGLQMILERIESAEADFGIANLDEVPDTLAYHGLFDTTLMLIARKNASFFRGKRPNLKQISKVPFIFFPHSSTITPLIEKTFAENNLKLNVVLVLNNFEDVKKYVRLGMGVTILDGYTLDEEDYEKMDIFPMGRFFSQRKYGLILRKKRYLSPTVKGFIKCIKPDLQL